jgi:hypothetical protein
MGWTCGAGYVISPGSFEKGVVTLKKQYKAELGRKAWVRPEVRTMSAGSAEARTTLGLDDQGDPIGNNRS